MRYCSSRLISIVMGVALCLATATAQAEGAVTIRRISIISGSTLELEIAANGPISPRAQLIHNPDRLILDFPNSTPATSLQKLDINRGDVVDARIGLFSSNPPVTRVVLDMKSPHAYQLFPSGNSVVIKFAGDAAALNASDKDAAASNDSPETIISIERTPIRGSAHQVLVQAAQQMPVAMIAPTPAPQPPVEVVFQNGLLTIRSTKANLAEVLSQVHRLTGAEIVVPPAAESEQVFTNLGPGAPKEVLASLLNGSNFNFIVIGSEHDPGGIRQVVLTPKQGGAPQALVYPCGSAQPSVVQTQAVPQSEPPVQAFGTPMPPEQVPDSGDAPPPPRQ